MNTAANRTSPPDPPRPTMEVVIEPRRHGYPSTADIRIHGADLASASGRSAMTSADVQSVLTRLHAVPDIATATEPDTYQPLQRLLHLVGPVGTAAALADLVGDGEPPLSIIGPTPDSPPGAQAALQGIALLELKRPDRPSHALRDQLQRQAQAATRIADETGQPVTVFLVSGKRPPPSALEGLPPSVHAVTADEFLTALLERCPADLTQTRPLAAFIAAVLGKQPRTGRGLPSPYEWLPLDLASLDIRLVTPVLVGQQAATLLTYNEIKRLHCWVSENAAEQILAAVTPLTHTRENLYPVRDVLLHGYSRGAVTDIPEPAAGDPMLLRGIQPPGAQPIWLLHQKQVDDLLRDLRCRLPGGQFPDIPVAWPREPRIGTASHLHPHDVLLWCRRQGLLREALEWLTTEAKQAAA